MWYVIQTKTGFEKELVEMVERVLDPGIRHRFLIPQFEDVLRSGGVCRIINRRLFPGYILVDIDDPREIITVRGRMKTHEFARILGRDEEDKEETISAVNEEDIEFLQSILKDGIMSVSYVELEKERKIKRIVGPLAKYGNHIVKIELRHRRAIVEAEVFGKKRRIKFGLWTDEDGEIPWIKDALEKANRPEYLMTDMDIGIHPGDRVVDLSGLYPDEVFTVESVNVLKRTVRTSIEIFGGKRSIELRSDMLERSE